MNSKTPLLEEIRIKLEACIFWAEQDPITSQDLASERVTLDTELLDMLAPKEGK